ncbi:hypothetical protein [Rathayibacter sp. VKM Ac-2927]|uniref:hypothetical protein n=1 Tax=Rathayibacter sp. VKM Ac-2927 TaxID=2929478 RepID=UPI001FB41468|nr:hypothetical protein [Rathayibacter sp. VKM Ac-2927]MCJ1688540.1 hypothetical protein [Rathayibacter sp. VKM Ac-2927]
MPLDPDSYDALSSRPQQDRRKPGLEDVVESVLLLLVLAALGAVFFFLLLVEQTGIAACSGNLDGCDLTLLNATTWMIPGVVAVFVVLTTVGLIRRSKTRRRSRSIPLVGMVVTFIAFVIASVLVSIALQGATG